jgi:hypothetical protein
MVTQARALVECISSRYQMDAPFPYFGTIAGQLTSNLVSSHNPIVTITNSDLDIAPTIAQFSMLAQAVDIRSHIIHKLSDNFAPIAWQRKRATSTSGLITYLLCIISLHHQQHCYLPLHDFILGMANVLADQCYHLFHLADAQLLSYFYIAFPQKIYWHLLPLRREIFSVLTSVLSRKRPDLLHMPKR